MTDRDRLVGLARAQAHGDAVRGEILTHFVAALLGVRAGEDDRLNAVRREILPESVHPMTDDDRAAALAYADAADYMRDDEPPGAWGPTAAQEEAWDAREDDARGSVL